MEPEEIGAAIRAFRAEKCPACGGKKDHVTDPFCDGCLECLPLELKERVCDTHKFLNAFHPALAHIKSNRGGPRNSASRSSGASAHPF